MFLTGPCAQTRGLQQVACYFLGRAVEPFGQEAWLMEGEGGTLRINQDLLLVSFSASRSTKMWTNLSHSFLHKATPFCFLRHTTVDFISDATGQKSIFLVWPRPLCWLTLSVLPSMMSFYFLLLPTAGSSPLLGFILKGSSPF